MKKHTDQKIENNQFESLIQGLINDNYGCCDDFMFQNTITGLHNNVNNLLLQGAFQEAGTGNDIISKKNQLIRGDHINWIENTSSNEFEILYNQKILRFINYLNSTCFTSIVSFESHYAHYKTGSFYKRHLDQFKNDSGRLYSIILYLNQDWKDIDEGNLSLYPSELSPIKISPIGGRLVFFKSDQMEHEVFPSSTRDRISIAGWLKISP